MIPSFTLEVSVEEEDLLRLECWTDYCTVYGWVEFKRSVTNLASLSTLLM